MTELTDITAIIFDLDDTLHDFTPSERTARAVICRKAADELNIPFDTLLNTYRTINSRLVYQWEDEKRMTTATIIEYRELVWKMTLNTLKIRCDTSLCRRLSEDYEAERLRNVVLYPDALQCLVKLHSRYPLVLISNGFRDSQRRQTELLGIYSYFTGLLFEGEIGFGKPDCRIFQRALHEVGQPPEKVLMVGDSPVKDIAGAQAVGCRTAWLNRNGKHQPPDSPIPDIIIEDLSALTNILI